MPKEVTVFYPNSKCFDERPNLLGNWFDSKFKNVYWSVEMCTTTTKNGGVCATPDQVKLFMEENLFYFLN